MQETKLWPQIFKHTQTHATAQRTADRQYSYERNQRLHNYVGRMEEYYRQILSIDYTNCLRYALHSFRQKKGKNARRKSRMKSTTNVRLGNGSSEPNQLTSNIPITGRRHSELLFTILSMNAANRNISQKGNCTMYIQHFSFRGCAGFNELIARLCIRFCIWLAHNFCAFDSCTL